MKYTTQEEKEKVRKAFKVFLAQHDLNLQKLIDNYNVGDYQLVSGRLNRNHISHEWIEGIAKKVNGSAKLEKFSSSFMFTFKSK